MSGHIIEFIIVLGFAGAFGGLYFGLLANIGYRITPFHLEILVLGVVVRRIPHQDIKSVTVRKVWPAENWCNTLKGNDRRLVIERHSGRVRHVIISPAYRFVFRAALAEARQQYELLRELQPDWVSEPPGFWEQVMSLSWGRLFGRLVPGGRKRREGKSVPGQPVPQYSSN